MILSCVKRVKDRLGYAVGATLIVRVLCGSADKRVLELGLDQLTTYGLMRGTSRPQVRDLLERLETEGYLRIDSIHGGVELAELSGGVLFRGERVELAMREMPKVQRQLGKKSAPAASGGEGGLFEALKALRFRLAQEEKVPAYIIFSNASLTDMAAKAPTTMTDFLEVSGVGQVKAARYGRVFIEKISSYLADA